HCLSTTHINPLSYTTLFRSWPVDAAHADAHQPDAPEVQVPLARREVVEKRRDDARPIRADRKARRVLPLPGSVDGQGGEPAAQEDRKSTRLNSTRFDLVCRL